MITGQVLGAGKVVADLNAVASGAPERVFRTVQSLGLELLAKVKGDKLTGQVLKVQTGRLRRSVNEKTTVSGAAVTSTVGTNVVYGRFWELGFSGDVNVRAHVRKTAKGAQAMVRAHQRRVNQPARPFLKPALEEMRARVLQQLTQAAKAVASGPQP